jgi:hypothetical protein
LPNPQLQSKELFEDDYMAKFEGLVRRRGLLANLAATVRASTWASCSTSSARWS